MSDVDADEDDTRKQITIGQLIGHRRLCCLGADDSSVVGDSMPSQNLYIRCRAGPMITPNF